MALEVERKFLVVSDGWREGAKACPIRQGYLCLEADATVRVRVAGENAFITVKGKTAGMSRSEFEYAVPLADAQAMLDELCIRPLIEKVRYSVTYAGKVWTVDVFEAANAGLIMAEVELKSPDEVVDIPSWVGEEVTYDPRYRNSSLVSEPQGE